MFIQKLQSCPEFIAGDNTILRELLHPAKQPLALQYSLAHAIVPADETSTLHSLSTSEVYYILTGNGEMFINGDSQPVEPGDAIYIPPNAKQSIRNAGHEPLIFECILNFV
jgi:mannose-6-phosphate isomerase-like protein (cupin superfamily)